MRKWYPLVIILIGYAAGAAVFARLPGRVPTHFDAHGIANGWSSRWFAVLFLPTLAMGVWPVMRLLPRIDPRRANYQRFQDTYDTVVNVVLTVLIVVHL